LVVEALLQDEENKMTTENEKRLKFSMIIVRFVNGMVDVEQKTSYASPVSVLADRLGIPKT